MKDLVRWIVGLLLAVIVVTILGLWFTGVSLFVSPFVERQQTAIVRQSNGYITAQQDLLRQLDTDYASAATPEQRSAAIRQMTEVADRIPGYVQPDIAAFLAQHGAAQQ